MSEVEHTIGALLREGATPNPSEVLDLSRLARFVGAMVARLTHGISQIGSQAFEMGHRPTSMLSFDHESPLLSAATADRWLEAMGQGAAMLEPRLSRSPGAHLDGDMWSRISEGDSGDLPIVRLVEGAALAPARGSIRGDDRGSRGLFGPADRRPTIDFSPSDAATAGGDRRGPVFTSSLVLADGSRLAPEAIAALADGGLALSASPATASPAPLGARAHFSPSSALDATSAFFQSSGLDSPAGPVHLDGLQIDGRTPALVAALRHALTRTPGALAPDQAGHPAVGSPERMGARVVEALGPQDRASDIPVQLAGAFDASAGDFLHVLPSRPSAGPASPTSAGAVPQPPLLGTPSIALDHIAPPSPSLLRPFTGGVFPSASASAAPILAPALHTPSGVAVPATERSPLGPTLIHGEAAAPIVEAHAHDLEPRARPLSGLTRHEAMAARVVAGRDAGSATSERFHSVVAGEPGPGQPGGLEEGVWVVLSSQERPRGLTPASLESMPVGRAIPMGLSPTPDQTPGPRGPGTDPAAPESSAASISTTTTARAARRALNRSTLTAREIQVLAPFVAELASHAEPRLDPGTTPSLVSHLVARQAPLDLAAIRGLDPAASEALLGRVLQSGTALAPELAETLLSAGWTVADLELLHLAPRSGAGTEVATASSPAQPGEGSRRVQGLARVLTGTEAVSTPTEVPAPVVGSEDLAASLGSRSYFEGLGAPGILTAGAAGAAGLRAVVGELLALARNAGASETQSMPWATRLTGASERVVSRHAETPMAGAGDAALVQPAAPQRTLSSRVAQAIARVGQGPAGIERLGGRSPARPAVDAGLDVGLGAALAPELMLPGLAETRPTRSIQTPELHREVLGLSPFPGPLGASSEGQAPLTRTSRVHEAPVAGYSPVLLHGVARGRQAAGPVAGRQRALADFGSAWLDRVDGGRAGLDLGIHSDQAPFAEAFGAEPGASFTDELHLVNTGVDERSSSGQGRRSASETGGEPRGPGRRSTPRAGRRATGSAAASFGHVDLGGRVGGPRRDLDQMSARVRGAATGGARSAMPLVAPAMQAVASHAMRSATSERAPGDRVRSEKVAGGASSVADEQQTGQAEASLSREAFEALAQQMADRVARELKRDRERRGSWT